MVVQNGQLIAGVRWKCKICPDYDLCDKCHTAQVHKEHEMDAIATPPEEPPKEEAGPTHEGIACDACAVGSIISLQSVVLIPSLI